MKKKDRLEQELREGMINLAVAKNWWKLVQSVESIRRHTDNKVAILWLGTALQSLIDLSLEFGHDRVLEAVPPEQRALLCMIIADGEDLAATALEDEDRLFAEWEFPPASEVFLLVQDLTFGPRNG
jgi:hypothetical protein